MDFILNYGATILNLTAVGLFLATIFYQQAMKGKVTTNGFLRIFETCRFAVVLGLLGTIISYAVTDSVFTLLNLPLMGVYAYLFAVTDKQIKIVKHVKEREILDMRIHEECLKLIRKLDFSSRKLVEYVEDREFVNGIISNFNKGKENVNQ